MTSSSVHLSTSGYAFIEPTPHAELRLPTSLLERDKRPDPAALCAVLAAEKAACGLAEERRQHLPIIGVTGGGCATFSGVVIEALNKKRPRQGYFSRSGPHMIATYCSLALQSHGPTFALIAPIEKPCRALGTALRLAACFFQAGRADELLIVEAETFEERSRAVAALIRPNKSRNEQLEHLIAELSDEEDLLYGLKKFAALTSCEKHLC